MEVNSERLDDCSAVAPSLHPFSLGRHSRGHHHNDSAGRGNRAQTGAESEHLTTAIDYAIMDSERQSGEIGFSSSSFREPALWVVASAG